MIAEYHCHECGRHGEVEINTAEWLNGNAMEKCPYCDNPIMQSKGEIKNAVPT